MTELSHTVRASLLANERSFQLGPDALIWKDNGTEGRLAFADIVQIRLITYASYGGAQAQCTIRDVSGSKVLVRSHHYESLGKFENRSATYTAFVSELARRVNSSNPDANFIAGSRGLWFAWLVVLVLVAVVLVFLVSAALEGTPLLPRVLGTLVPVLVSAAIAWRMMRRNNQKTFDPINIPTALLGR